MSTREDCEIVVSSVVRVGVRTAQVIITLLAEPERHRQQACSEQLWDFITDCMLSEIGDVLRAEPAAHPEVVIILQGLALQACENEFCRLMDGGMAAGGRA